jgi:heme/copper-type cytochrome/quinol oxidase subunit 2
MRGRLSAVAASPALSVALALAWLTLAPHPAAACAVCFGAAEGAEAAGLRAGILLLLGMVALVFAGVGGFLVAARRRLQRLQASTEVSG